MVEFERGDGDAGWFQCVQECSDGDDGDGFIECLGE